MGLGTEDLSQHVFFDVLHLFDQFIDQYTCVHRVPHRSAANAAVSIL
jgi:hypothetical protein